MDRHLLTAATAIFLSFFVLIALHVLIPVKTTAAGNSAPMEQMVRR